MATEPKLCGPRKFTKVISCLSREVPIVAGHQDVVGSDAGRMSIYFANTGVGDIGITPKSLKITGNQMYTIKPGGDKLIEYDKQPCFTIDEWDAYGGGLADFLVISEAIFKS
jgi:hypothetical protein